MQVEYSRGIPRYVIRQESAISVPVNGWLETLIGSYNWKVFWQSPNSPLGLWQTLVCGRIQTGYEDRQDTFRSLDPIDLCSLPFIDWEIVPK